MPSVVGLLKRGSQCAYHSNDKSGKTWNPYGDLCPAIGDDQWLHLYIGIGICCAALLGLALVFIIRAIRARRQANEPLEVPIRPADVLDSPLLKEKRSQRFHDGPMARSRSNSIVPGSPLSYNGGNEFSPQQQYRDYNPQHQQQHLRVDNGSQSSHSSHSAYSPRPESLHFPILNANGQLLPPPVASSRNSYIDNGDPFGPRVLPTPPPAQLSEPRQLGRPVEQWQYLPEQTPSPERENYYNTRTHEPSVEMLRDERSHVHRGLPQPQSATYHRSLSAEGEDMSEPDYGSEEDGTPRRSQLIYDRH